VPMPGRKGTRNPPPRPTNGPAGAQPSIIRGPGFFHLPTNSRLDTNSPASPTGAVFLDRDGVLVEDVHFLTEPGQLKILPGVAEALRDLQDRFYLIVVTNQSGIARGLLTEDDLLEIHAELVSRLGSQGALLDGLYYCPHLPEASISAYKVECRCRKPGPGMLEQAAGDWGIDLSRSVMAGDMPRDIEAARAAGVKGIITGGSHTQQPGSLGAVRNLPEAVPLILSLAAGPQVDTGNETAVPNIVSPMQSSQSEVK